MRELALYQTEIARAVLDSVLHDRGLTITVEIARGAGAREIAAQLEMLLLALHVNEGVRLLRVGPADRQPAVRLARHLRQGPVRGLASVHDDVVRLGRAEVRYLTPEQACTVSGPVVLLQVTNAETLDGGQLHGLDRLAEASGATMVLYGTAWNGETAFESRKQANRELEATGPARLHFRVPWQQVADELPGYRERVEEVRAYLGETNPEFQARYALLPAPALGPLLGDEQRRSIGGDHARRHARTPGVPTRASVVLTRPPSTGQGRDAPAHGATAVVTIAELAPDALRVVEHRWLEAVDAPAIAQGIAEVVGETWRCAHVVADAPGAATAAADQVRHLLARALRGPAAVWATGTEAEVSRDVRGLLAATHAGRLRLYQADGSPEYRTLRHELDSRLASFKAGGVIGVELPSSDEGFLRGLLMLTGQPDISTDAYQRDPQLEPALAS